MKFICESEVGIFHEDFFKNFYRNNPSSKLGIFSGEIGVISYFLTKQKKWITPETGEEQKKNGMESLLL